MRTAGTFADIGTRVQMPMPQEKALLVVAVWSYCRTRLLDTKASIEEQAMKDSDLFLES